MPKPNVERLSREPTTEVTPLRDIFYVYNFIFYDLHVEISIDDFTMSVICILNVAPSQLHMNGWMMI